MALKDKGSDLMMLDLIDECQVIEENLAANTFVHNIAASTNIIFRSFEIITKPNHQCSFNRVIMLDSLLHERIQEIIRKIFAPYYKDKAAPKRKVLEI